MIRRAVSDDVPELRRVIDAAYAPYRDAGIALPDIAGGLPEDVQAGRAWVADAGKVNGVLVLSCSGATAHLMNVAVHPNAAGQGVGKALITHALEQARAAGCRELALTTHRDMPDNIALYRHLGWHETGREGAKVFMLREIETKEGGG